MRELESQGGVLGKREIMLLPGPVSLSQGVKEALMQDYSPWGDEFVEVTQGIADSLLKIAGVSEENRDAYEVVFNQGCGSFMLEALCNVLVPKKSGKLLVLKNGMYGQRILDCAGKIGCRAVVYEEPITKAISPQEIDKRLREDGEITHVWAVHCETSTGILNPVSEIAAVVKAHDRRLIVDSVASFGCEDQLIETWGADAICATSNKCLEGAPGFSFACVKGDVLAQSVGNAHSFSMDLCEQHQAYKRTGRWRYTPPTHVVMAFARGIKEFWQEGGVAARRKRYQANMDALLEGMAALNFCSIADKNHQSCVIATFLQPDVPSFDRERFNQLLQAGGFVIYPGWQTGDTPSIRIATIGALVTPEIIKDFIEVVGSSLKKMRVSLEALDS